MLAFVLYNDDSWLSRLVFIFVWSGQSKSKLGGDFKEWKSLERCNKYYAETAAQRVRDWKTRISIVHRDLDFLCHFQSPTQKWTCSFKWPKLYDYNPSRRLAKILETFKEIPPDSFLQEKAFLATMAAKHNRVLPMTEILEHQEKAYALETKILFYKYLAKIAQFQFPEEKSLERKLNPGLRADARKWLRDVL